MVGLYGPAYFRRFRELGACVENGSSVVDLCCGFGDFYVYALRDKGIKYTGVDLSGEFAVYAAKKGINVQQGNIENYEFPSADYYVMIGSLYHFQNPQDVIQDPLWNALSRADQTRYGNVLELHARFTYSLKNGASLMAIKLQAPRGRFIEIIEPSMGPNDYLILPRFSRLNPSLLTTQYSLLYFLPCPFSPFSYNI